MKIIVGNWKMYPQKLAEAKDIFQKINKRVRNQKRVKIVVCPPAVFLSPLIALGKSAKVSLGAQNSSAYDEGAYTGETSPSALSSIGASYVILGHSERRAMGEDDGIIAQKAIAAVRRKLIVILCVGEKERDSNGEYFGIVRDQLRGSLHKFPKASVGHLVVAYEPIWAIGTKAMHAAYPADFREMSILIRRHLVDYFGKKAGFSIPILYGGSVDDRNAVGFLTDGGADGLLIGRVSLNPESFNSIIRSAESLY